MRVISFLLTIALHLLLILLFFYYREIGIFTEDITNEKRVEKPIRVIEVKARSIASKPQKPQSVESSNQPKSLENKTSTEDLIQQLPEKEIRPQKNINKKEMDFSQSSSLKGFEAIKQHGRSQYSMITQPVVKEKKRHIPERNIRKQSKESNTVYASLDQEIYEMAEACYPEEARQKGIEGAAVIAILESYKSDIVANARLIESTGDTQLDYCALSVAESIINNPSQMQLLREMAETKGEYVIKISFGHKK